MIKSYVDAESDVVQEKEEVTKTLFTQDMITKIDQNDFFEK